VGITLTDTPPAGVTVLFFQLSLTGATLTPASTSASTTAQPVSLVSSTNPIPINISQLQTDVAFLGNQNVAAGDYTSLSLTFANPQLTIFNASDTSISSTCAVGSVCQVTPPASGSNALTLTFSSSPFPITLSANSPLAFKVDVHMDTVIQSDLSLNLGATNGVTVSEVKPHQPGGPIAAVGKLIGTVGTPGNNQFPLTTIEGRSFTINVNDNTTYSNFPSSVCSTEEFSCLASGQAVKVTVTLQTDGTLLATAVDFIQLPTQQTVEGTLIGLNTSNGNTVMDLIVQQQPNAGNTNVLPVGRHARVIVPATGVTFTIDWGTFTAPTGVTLNFAAATDLQVGQELQVVVQGNITTPSSSGATSMNGPTPFGSASVSFTASSISLEPSQITGSVASLPAQGSLSFTMATMPCFFVPPAATWGTVPRPSPYIFTVQTTGSTTFTNFTTDSLAGVAVNDVISVHGWIFATPTGATPVTMAADTVLYRTASLF
jgi:hypothetical protein